jgi:hypothetical protein
MMLKLMQISPLFGKAKDHYFLADVSWLAREFLTIEELVLCNCTERAEGDKMREGRGRSRMLAKAIV